MMGDADSGETLTRLLAWLLADDVVAEASLQDTIGLVEDHVQRGSSGRGDVATGLVVVDSLVVWESEPPSMDGSPQDAVVLPGRARTGPTRDHRLGSERASISTGRVAIWQRGHDLGGASRGSRCAQQEHERSNPAHAPALPRLHRDPQPTVPRALHRDSRPRSPHEARSRWSRSLRPVGVQCWCDARQRRPRVAA